MRKQPSALGRGFSGIGLDCRESALWFGHLLAAASMRAILASPPAGGRDLHFAGFVPTIDIAWLDLRISMNTAIAVFQSHKVSLPGTASG